MDSLTRLASMAILLPEKKDWAVTFLNSAAYQSK
jgi:hypothetical protein